VVLAQLFASGRERFNGGGKSLLGESASHLLDVQRAGRLSALHDASSSLGGEIRDRLAPIPLGEEAQRL
jgi:hypothetical protein